MKDEVTPEPLYTKRREFLKSAGLFAATATGIGAGLVWLTGGRRADPETRPTGARLGASRSTDFAAGERRTPYADVTTYNNFYELGTSKEDPAIEAASLRTRPWTIEIAGEVARPQRIDVDTLLRAFPLEERTYRMRCVEAWSMVIPWLGFPLSALVRRVEPTSHARFVAMTTLLDPERLAGQKDDVLPWPYVEGLRLDEALHPLALLAVGLYGRVLPGQNGAPIRLVVPWKYGFKGIKSIVRIEFVRSMPPTTWSLAAPNEYGFYANVNPRVDHPRWSQATERRIGELGRRPTLPFNGYADEVGGLYSGMDLARWF